MVIGGLQDNFDSLIEEAKKIFSVTDCVLFDKNKHENSHVHGYTCLSLKC